MFQHLSSTFVTRSPVSRRVSMWSSFRAATRTLLICFDVETKNMSYDGPLWDQSLPRLTTWRASTES